MIYIRTCAYNAEKTLQRAVDSVLNQTYQDFEYHILDNGSQDSTGELLRMYARQDKRIVPYFNKVNRAYQENPDFWNLTRHIPEQDYFCVLDADDAYEPTFLEEILRFMQENRLEMAACGTRFLDASTGDSRGENLLPQNIIIDSPAALDAFFPMIHWNLRQVWGKLYSAKVAQERYEIDLPDWYPTAYGGDTVNTMHCAQVAGRFGVYAKTLHTYTMSKKSVSHKWIPGREAADVTLHEKAVEFLEQSCGSVSQKNLCFLYAVYFHAIQDTLEVLYTAQLPLLEKLGILNAIWSHSITQEMMEADTELFGLRDEQKSTLLQKSLRWLEQPNHTYSAKTAALLQDFYTQFNADFPKLVSAEHLIWYMKKTPQLLSALAKQDYASAMQSLSQLLAGGLVQNRTAPVLLAQTLSALLQRQEDYIRYSKLLIEGLIKCKEYPQAEEELTQWEAILPEDGELAQLRWLLSKKTGRVCHE